jgi:hypothetical protein
MAYVFPYTAFNDYYTALREIQNNSLESKTPDVVYYWYTAILERDTEKLKELAISHPIPELFEYASTNIFSIYEAIVSVLGKTMISREVLEFLLEKVVPFEYRGSVMIDIFYHVSIFKPCTEIGYLCNILDLFKPEEILVVPDALDYIMSIFPIYNKDYIMSIFPLYNKNFDGDKYDITECCVLLDILEKMFPGVDLYEKLSGEKKKIVARVEGKYVDIRK